MKKMKNFSTLLLFLVLVNTAVLAQSRVVLNEGGGTASNDDILTIISPTGQINVFYKGFRQNYGHTALPSPVPISYGSYGSAPVVRFKFSASDNTDGSNGLTPITSCSITPPIGTGTSADPQRTILTGTVKSPRTNQVYYVTCTFSWSGGRMLDMDYAVRAPFNLTTAENVHLYIDEDTYAGDDDYGLAFGKVGVSGEYVGGYRINDNCKGNSNSTRIATMFYGYKVKDSFSSTYSASYGSRTNNVSSTNLNLSGDRNTSCTDNGIAIHVTFPTFTIPGQVATRRIVLALSSITTGTDNTAIYNDNDNYFDSIIVEDPEVPTISSPVAVEFISANFAEAEGDHTHQATSIKVKVKKGMVGNGILETDQTVGLNVTGGTAVQNTDFSYQNAFIVPAGDYSVEKIITINSISIIGNQIIQGNRTVNMKLVGDACNDLIQLGVQQTATFTIQDDDCDKYTLSVSPNPVDAGSTATVAVALESGATIASGVSLSLSVDREATSTAVAGTHYSATLPQNFTLNSATTSRSFTIPTIIGVGSSRLDLKATPAITGSNVTCIPAAKTASLEIKVRVITLSVDKENIDEGGGAAGTAIVKAKLADGDIAPTGGISFTLTYTGTATSGVDYTGAATIAIAQGQNEGTVSIITNAEDYLLEGDETVIISAPASITALGVPFSIVGGPLSVTIKDKTDGSIIAEKYKPAGEDASEPNVDGSFRIRFKDENVKSVKPATVSFKLSGVSATSYTVKAVTGSVTYDALTAEGTAVIPASSNGVEVTIEVVDNYVVEGTRNLKMEIFGTPIW